MARWTFHDLINLPLMIALPAISGLFGAHPSVGTNLVSSQPRTAAAASAPADYASVSKGSAPCRFDAPVRASKVVLNPVKVVSSSKVVYAKSKKIKVPAGSRQIVVWISTPQG